MDFEGRMPVFRCRSPGSNGLGASPSCTSLTSASENPGYEKLFFPAIDEFSTDHRLDWIAPSWFGFVIWLGSG
jgi:hypothetical protein